MKLKSIYFICLIVILSLTHTKAQDKGFGLGIILGEPTGLSAKYWTTSINAFDFGLGYSFSPKNSRFHFHIDYLFHTQLSGVEEKLLLHYGPGARIKTREDDDANLGVRGVIGITWIPRNAPVDLFIEIAPILNLIPGTTFSINGGFGARFYF
ncbi:MAG: hypothetical protein Kow0098_07210 [Ignavibacteriaceae bacterium]